MARQCLISAILHQPATESSATVKEGLQQSQLPELLAKGQAEEAKCEDLENFVIGEDPERFFQVGTQLPLQEKEELVAVLQKNVDISAWDAYEAPGVDLSFICHHLNVSPSVIPRKQPPQRSSKEHSDVVKDEVMKLKQARAIKEVFLP